MRLTLTTIDNKADNDFPLLILPERWLYVPGSDPYTHAHDHPTDTTMRLVNNKSEEVMMTPQNLKLFNKLYSGEVPYDLILSVVKNHGILPKKALQYLFEICFYARELTPKDKQIYHTNFQDFKETGYLLDVFTTELDLLPDYADALTKLLVGTNVPKNFDVAEEFNKQRLNYYQLCFPDTPMVQAKAPQYLGQLSPYKSASVAYNTQGEWNMWKAEHPEAEMEIRQPTFSSPQDAAMFKQIIADEEWWYKHRTKTK